MTEHEETVQIGPRIPISLKKRLAMYALKEEIKQETLITQLLERFLDSVGA